MTIQRAIQVFAGQPLTHTLLTGSLQDYNWPQNKLASLVDEQVLVPVKRGLYIPGPASGVTVPSPLLLANHIYGPSYITVETALSYWGLIPEKVAAVYSMTTGTARTYHTPVGRFIYIRARLPYYSLGLQQVEVGERQVVLMASKEKALCDKVITTKGLLLRSVRQTRDFLIEDLRMEEGHLAGFDTNRMGQWVRYAPKRASLEILINTLQAL